MNITKCNALKTLGFNYITRDMDGKLLAWKTKPVRIVTIIDWFVEEYNNKYTGADVRVESEIDEDDIYIEGYHVYYCCFQCSKEDNGVFHGHYELDNITDEYSEVTWENSPYELK